MSISERQFNLLTAMDIPVWASRSLTNDNDSVTAIDYQQLSQHRIIKDIQLAFALNNQQWQVSEQGLRLDDVHWIFADVSESRFDTNQLISPFPKMLAQDPQLKRQLWQTLCATPLCR